MPSGNGIHIVKADDAHPHGVPPDEYLEFRNWLAAHLLDVRDQAGERIVARVRTRDELFRGPSLALAPDLTLELEDGGLVSILSSAEPVRRRPMPTGTHRADGVFIAAGPEIQRGARLVPLSILDVAPLVLHALDLPIPDTLEGRFVSEALEPAALAMHPPRRESGASAVVPVTDVALDAAAEAEILDRLRALGYVE